MKDNVVTSVATVMASMSSRKHLVTTGKKKKQEPEVMLQDAKQ